MTRLKISIGILIFLVLLSTFSAVSSKKICNELYTQLEQIEETAEKNNTDEAIKLCSTLQETWHNKKNFLIFTIRRDKLLNTEESIQKLQSMLESDCDEFTAEIESIKLMLDYIVKEEIPSIKNIL
ncbi:MAG: DUF4363 family protein [Ruminococcus sp.]|nr:DUF4363 family protein [Ruminococcus sp.]